MGDLTPPCCESNIKPPNLSRWKLLDSGNCLPVLDPLATFARKVSPNPTLLAFTAEIHTTQRHVCEAYLSSLLKT
jgi:hypothetical protein